MVQTVKNPPAMQETWVRSLGQEDPLEKEMATHSSILSWRIPWTEATVHGVAKSWTWLSTLFFIVWESPFPTPCVQKYSIPPPPFSSSPPFLKNPSPSSLPMWVQYHQGKTSHKMRNSAARARLGLGCCYQLQESPAPSNLGSTVSFYNSWLTSAPSTPPHQSPPAAGWQVCQMRPWGWTLPFLHCISLNYQSPATLGFHTSRWG